MPILHCDRASTPTNQNVISGRAQFKQRIMPERVFAANLLLITIVRLMPAATRVRRRSSTVEFFDHGLFV
jgi:hypothetical protein